MIFSFGTFELPKTDTRTTMAAAPCEPWQYGFEGIPCHCIPSFNHPPSCRFKSDRACSTIFSSFLLTPPAFSLSCGWLCLLKTAVIHLAHIKRLWWASRGSVAKNLPLLRKTWVRFLGGEDPLEKGMATHSSILAWRIPRTKEPWWATVHGVARSQIQLKRLSSST